MSGFLPNAEQAVIPPEKLTDYLLSPTHPKGKDKEAFFRSFGFRRERWEELREVLLRHALDNPVIRDAVSSRGVRYVVEGPLDAPDGRHPAGLERLVRGHGWNGPSADHCVSSLGAEMLKEHDQVVLTEDLPGIGLQAGDIGVIVYIHRDGQAYEVEFIAVDGHTIGVETVEADQVRPVTAEDFPHARQIPA